MKYILVLFAICFSFCIPTIVQETAPEEVVVWVQPEPTPRTIKPERESLVSVSRGESEKYVETFIGIVTLYTEAFESCGKLPNHPEYGITNSGKRVTPHHTIAMDKKYPFGTLVRVEGFNELFVVEDRGSAITGNDVDIYIPEKPDGEKQADLWCMKKLRIYIIRLGRDENDI